MATALPLVVPGRARASVGGIMASHFDGQTCLQNDKLVYMVASNPYFVLSYWYASTGNPNNNGMTIVRNADSSNNYTFIISQSRGDFSMAFADDINWDNAMGITSNNPDTVPNDGNFHYVLMSGDATKWGWWDYLSSPACQSGDYTLPGIQCYVDNQPVGPFYGAGGWGGGGFNIGLANTGLSWAVGGPGPGWTTSDADFYVGDMANFHFFTPPAFVDISDPAIRAGFIDQNTLLPVRDSSDGGCALRGLGLMPQWYLYGPASLFPINFAAMQSFTWNSATPTTPSGSFYTASGTLQTAVVDPWGYTGS